MTMVVRDEADVLSTNLDYHLGQGVDLVLVTDHSSTDRTPDILADYAHSGRVRVWREDEAAYRQRSWVARMLEAGRREHGVDWVLHGDADEFWVPLTGSLRDVFSAVPEQYGYLVVPSRLFLPASGGSEPFHRHMVVYRPLRRAWGKVAQRPAAGSRLSPGNHFLSSASRRAPDAGTVEIHHFQTRSFEQLARRAERVAASIGLGGDLGPHTRRLIEAHRTGRLDAFYETVALTPEQTADGLESGELVLDPRMHALLTGGQPGRRESPQAQAVLSRLWQRVSSS